MTHSYGKRSGTRYKFARPYRGHGMPAVTTYLTTYKRGDYVTIKVNGAIHKGTPTAFYHGRTGRVFDVTNQSYGVEIVKRIGNREIIKRIHIRREHVVLSKAPLEFIQRRANNDKIARENVNSKTKINYKREILGPRPAEKVFGKIVETTPVPFYESY